MFCFTDEEVVVRKKALPFFPGRHIRFFDVISEFIFRFTKEETEVRKKSSHLFHHAISEFLTFYPT